MIVSVNAILEMLATLICVNYLFDQKYSVTIYDTVFFTVEVILFVIGNNFNLSKGLSLVGYIDIYIYELLKFKCSWRKATVNLVLLSILCVLAQIICSVPVFAMAQYVDMNILVTLVNSLMILIFFLLGKKHVISKISIVVMRNNLLSSIATVICFLGTVYLLVVYKLDEYLRITDYIVFGMLTILVGVLIMSWQREKYEKTVKEKELELRENYDEVYKQLLESMRKKQHDFHNHIMDIYSQHMLTQDYNTLVEMQKKYCEEIMADNRYAKLISSNSPMVIAFLYSKFITAEGEGCTIDYNVRVDKLKCQIPQYKLVEMLGILFDNAVESIKTSKRRNIYVEFLEMEDVVKLAIKNDSRHFERLELMSFFEQDYTTKGKNRGIGLTKVKDIVMQYDASLNVYCEIDQSEKLVFEIIINK